MMRRLETRKKSILFVGLLAAVVSVGCKGSGETEADKEKAAADETTSALDGLSPEQAALVVAKVGDKKLIVGDITEQINKLSPYIRRRWAAPEKRKEFLDNLIRVELLSQEAERLGLGKDNPEVERTVDQVMVRLMIKNDLEKELIPTTVEESVLKAEYEREKDKYRRPAQIRVSHIVVKTQGEAEKLLSELQAKPTDSRFYREMVKTHSIDEATKTSGGDLGYFSETGEKSAGEEKIDPALAAAAWKIERIGQFSDAPVKTDTGYHILKLTNRRAKLERSFESVKRMIENRLLREKRKEAMDKFVAELRSKAKVEINEDALSELEIPQDVRPHNIGGLRPAERARPRAYGKEDSARKERFEEETRRQEK